MPLTVTVSVSGGVECKAELRNKKRGRTFASVSSLCEGGGVGCRVVQMQEVGGGERRVVPVGQGDNEEKRTL